MKLAWEKELLGLYVTAHPLEDYAHTLSQLSSIATLKASGINQTIVIGGLVTSVKTIITKRGEQMCFASVEDLSGTIEVVVFPRCYAESKNILQADSFVKIWGKFESDEGESKILADRITNLQPTDPEPDKSEPGITLEIPAHVDPLVFRRLRSVFEKYPGTARVHLRIASRIGEKKPITTDFKVNDSPELREAVSRLLS
jgi:DNA polymerase-3 subunit alpha